MQRTHTTKINEHTIRANLLAKFTGIKFVVVPVGGETYYQIDYSVEAAGGLSQFIQSQGLQLMMVGYADALLNYENAIKLLDRFRKEEGFEEKYLRCQFIYKQLDAFLTGTHVLHIFMGGVLNVRCNEIDEQFLQPLIDTGLGTLSKKRYTLSLNALIAKYSANDFKEVMDKLIRNYQKKKDELSSNYPQIISELEAKLVNAVRESNIFMLTHIHILNGFCDKALVSPEHHQKTLMYYAAQYCQSAIVLEYLYDQGLSVSEPLIAGPYAGMTPVFAAAEAGNLTALKYFISCSVNVADTLKFGACQNMAPLDIAVINNKSTIVDCLLVAGVSSERLDLTNIRKKLNSKDALKVLRVDNERLFKLGQLLRQQFGISNIIDASWTSDAGYTLLRLNNHIPNLYYLRQYLDVLRIPNALIEDHSHYLISRHYTLRLLDILSSAEQWQIWLKFKNKLENVLDTVKSRVKPALESVLSGNQIIDIPGGFIIQPSISESFILRDFLLSLNAEVMTTMPGIYIEFNDEIDQYSEFKCLEARHGIMKLSLYFNTLKMYMRNYGATRNPAFQDGRIIFQFNDSQLLKQLIEAQPTFVIENNCISFNREEILKLNLESIYVKQQQDDVEVIQQPVEQPIESMTLSKDIDEQKIELLDKIVCNVKLGKTGKKRFVDGGILFAFRTPELEKSIKPLLNALLVEQDEAGLYLLSYYKLHKVNLTDVQSLYNLCMEQIKKLSIIKDPLEPEQKVRLVPAVKKVKEKSKKQSKKKKKVRNEETKTQPVALKPKKDWSYRPKQIDRDFDLLGLKAIRADRYLTSSPTIAAADSAEDTSNMSTKEIVSDRNSKETQVKLVALPKDHNAYEGCLHTELQSLQEKFDYVESLILSRSYLDCESLIVNASIWLSMVRVFNAIYENHRLGLNDHQIKIDSNSDIIAGEIRKDILATFFAFGNVTRFYDELLNHGFIKAVNRYILHKPAKKTIDLSLTRLSLFAVKEEHTKPADNQAAILVVLDQLKQICNYQPMNENCPKLHAMEAHLVELGDLIFGIEVKPADISEDLFKYLKKVCRKLRNVASHHAVHAAENGYDPIPREMVKKMVERVVGLYIANTSKPML